MGPVAWAYVLRLRSVSKASQPKQLPPLPTAGGSYVLNEAGDGWDLQPKEEPSTAQLIEDQDDA